MIRVLIVEDSPSVRDLLIRVLESDPDIAIAGVAEDGKQAITDVARLKPDVVTMDVIMPKMDGLEATAHIMRQTPVPIVMVSSTYDTGQVDATFRAMEVGAVAAVAKPAGLKSPEFGQSRAQLLRTVKLMSEVKVVRRRSPAGSGQNPDPPTPEPDRECRVAAIGSSTGGPPVLAEILESLTSLPAFPVLVVQHIAPGFVRGLVKWLGSRSAIPVMLASDGEPANSGTVYIAPDGTHTGIGRDLRIRLSTSPPVNGMRPSAAHLFKTVSEAFGRNSAGILLTGMGRDGSEELKLLYDLGADTIAQDRDSCVVHGMAGHAIELGAVRHILTPRQIASHLVGTSAEMRQRGIHS